MRTALLALALSPALAVAQFSDQFTDGDFTSGPSWSGDAAKFEVDGSSRLHLNAPAVADVAYLSTPSGAINSAEWTFWLRMDFNPSSSNYADILLVANQPNPTLPFNGYFVRCGGTDDEVALFRKAGATSTKIIDGANGTLNTSTVNVRVKVTRDSLGNWELLSDTSGLTSYVSEGTVLDNTWFQSSHFAIYCTYTSTRSDKFWFDDFNVTGQPFVDSVKPYVTSMAVVSSTQLDVGFSEFLETVSAETTSNYTVDNGVGNALSAQLDGSDSTLVHVTFAPFVNGFQHTLSVFGVMDRSNNTMDPDAINFTWFVAQPLDVMVNEIMADPSPVVGLPDAEFVELFNTTSIDIPLTGWTFSDASSTVTIPNVTLPADSFIILCAAADTALFQAFGVVAGISLPALNNTGDDLTLHDSSGQVIHTVSYSDSWYRDGVKMDGGWTLEQIDVQSPCLGSSNWIASIDPSGGTPGRANSVTGAFVDTSSPDIVSITVLSIISIEIVFDEPLDTSLANDVSNYFISPGIGQPLMATPQPGFYDAVVLQFPPVIDTGTLYTVTVTNATDCFGNSGTVSGAFIVPLATDSGDLVINEILFNPLSGGVDFLELYNRSNKILDLNGLDIVEADPGGVLVDETTISDQLLFYPGSYLALTSDPDIVRSQYVTPNPDSVMLVTSFPNWPDDEGIARIQLDSGHVLDELHYSDDWHFDLIDIVDGVSLERLRFDAPTNDPDNWFSAASTVGYATPAYQNSHLSEGVPAGDVSVEPEVFSPDQDGYKDVITIEYAFNEPGFVATMNIFDAEGRLVRHLVNNELLAAEGFFLWDGLGDDDLKVRIGIYIVWLEVFDLSGQVRHFKLKCVVAGKL